MRFFVCMAVAVAALGLSAGIAMAMTLPEDSAQPASSEPTLTLPPVSLVVSPSETPTWGGGGSGSGSGSGVSSQAPSGCRDLDVVASQKSVLFRTTIYKFHQVKHWCWRRGVVYDERHAWSFDGSSTACFDSVYPANHWEFAWDGNPSGGDFSEERAHVTNCVFHIGDWKEFYPDVKIWAYADGTYKVATSN